MEEMYICHSSNDVLVDGVQGKGFVDCLNNLARMLQFCGAV
jgi:hypothetical protein